MRAISTTVDGFTLPPAWTDNLHASGFERVSSVVNHSSSRHYGHRPITNSLEQSPSCEADSRSASQEIPLPLWNPKVHYRVHKSPLPVAIHSHINPVYILPPYFIEIHFDYAQPISVDSCFLRPSSILLFLLRRRWSFLEVVNACFIYRQSPIRGIILSKYWHYSACLYLALLHFSF
jgi:hypothetical protein